MMKLIFGLQINVKDFFKFILSFVVCVATFAQIVQNNKFTISLQYLKEKVSDEVDFLLAGKHQSFLQVDFNTFGIEVSYKVMLSLIGMIKHSETSQSNKFANSLQYLKK